ncbi:MAG: lysophospholipase L1-like esterase [Rhodothermales bacterium]|jgi:lysophospholipase L1-like esterase
MERPPNISRRRLWFMRISVVCAPAVALILLEGLLRVAGAFAPTPADMRVEFEAGTVFFPEWDAEIAMPKPEGTGRIFVLGGSSAMGFGVEAPFSELIQRDLPGEWEVINGGVVAYGSHRVLEVLRRAREFKPDAIVLYFGHNEFLEDVFYDPDGVVAKAESLGRLGRRLHLVNCARSFIGPPKTPMRPKLQRHFVANTQFPLIHSDAEFAVRLQLVEANLRQMIGECWDAGIKLLVLPAVTNLLAPPGDYVQHSPEWQARVDRAQENLDQQNWGLAATVLKDAHRLDDQHALSHYLLGLAELGRGQMDAAQRTLLMANQLDARGDRNNPRLTEAILAVCQEEGGPAVDVGPIFYAQLSAEFAAMQNGKRGRLFLDHCHPSEEGHRLIAEAILPLLRALSGYE